MSILIAALVGVAVSTSKVKRSRSGVIYAKRLYKHCVHGHEGRIRIWLSRFLSTLQFTNLNNKHSAVHAFSGPHVKGGCSRIEERSISGLLQHGFKPFSGEW